MGAVLMSSTCSKIGYKFKNDTKPELVVANTIDDHFEG